MRCSECTDPYVCRRAPPWEAGQPPSAAPAARPSSLTLSGALFTFNGAYTRHSGPQRLSSVLSCPFSPICSKQSKEHFTLRGFCWNVTDRERFTLASSPRCIMWQVLNGLLALSLLLLAALGPLVGAAPTDGTHEYIFQYARNS